MTDTALAEFAFVVVLMGQMMGSGEEWMSEFGHTGAVIGLTLAEWSSMVCGARLAGCTLVCRGREPPFLACGGILVRLNSYYRRLRPPMRGKVCHLSAVRALNHSIHGYIVFVY